MSITKYRKKDTGGYKEKSAEKYLTSVEDLTM